MKRDLALVLIKTEVYSYPSSIILFKWNFTIRNMSIF